MLPRAARTRQLLLVDLVGVQQDERGRQQPRTRRAGEPFHGGEQDQPVPIPITVEDRDPGACRVTRPRNQRETEYPAGCVDLRTAHVPRMRRTAASANVGIVGHEDTLAGSAADSEQNEHRENAVSGIHRSQPLFHVLGARGESLGRAYHPPDRKSYRLCDAGCEAVYGASSSLSVRPIEA